MDRLGLTPTKKLFFSKNFAHSSSIRVLFVCNELLIIVFWWSEFCLQLNNFLEKVQTCQQRFTSLPNKPCATIRQHQYSFIRHHRQFFRYSLVFHHIGCNSSSHTLNYTLPKLFSTRVDQFDLRFLEVSFQNIRYASTIGET
jgi:hypothetical protein